MKNKVAGLALILRFDVEYEDSRPGSGQLCDVAITNDHRRIGLVHGNDQVWSFERTLETDRKITGLRQSFNCQSRLRSSCCGR